MSAGNPDQKIYVYAVFSSLIKAGRATGQPSGSQVGSALVLDRCFLGAVPVAGGVSAPSVLRSPKMTP